MADQVKHTSLRDVAAELQTSYRAAWSAAHKGKLPAVQPFGKGTAWYVVGNYADFIGKAAEQQDETNTELCGGNSQ